MKLLMNAQNLNINQVAKLSNVTVSDSGKLNINQQATIDSTVNCINEAFNIRDIATEMSTTSGQTASQTLEAIALAKTKQDTQNTLKQTKLQKNMLDSLMGNWALILIIVVVIILFGGDMLKGEDGGGKGGEGGSGGGNFASNMVPYVLLFCTVVLIGGTCYLAFQHREAFKSKKLTSSSKNNKNAIFFIEKAGNKFKIFHGKGDNRKQLVVSDPDVNSPDSNKVNRPKTYKNIEFTKAYDDKDNNSNFQFEEIPNKTPKPEPTTPLDENGNPKPAFKFNPDPKNYKITINISGTNYQLGFLYDNNTEKIKI